MSKVSMFGLDREMGYTRREFFKQVPRTFKEHRYAQRDDGVTVELGSGRVDIRVGPQQQRQITPMMRLPYLEVSIRFSDVDEAAQRDFMRLFDTSFQKGGG